MIHTTIGVYASGERKVNGVPSEDLAAHLKYNIYFRFGRALFLDGICLHHGYLTNEEVVKLEAEFKENPVVMTRDTAPYQ